MENSISKLRPELLIKWNYEKNTGLSPENIAPHSTQKVWWKCPSCGKNFEARICDIRKADKCKFCKGNKFVNAGRDGTYTVYCHIAPNGKLYIGFTGMPIKNRFGKGKLYSENTRFGKAIKKIWLE